MEKWIINGLLYKRLLPPQNNQEEDRNTQYRVIHKSLWDFQPLWYSRRDGHTEGEHVNRGRDTPSFCPTLQVLDMSTLGDAADVNPVIKFLPRDLPQLRQRIVGAGVAIDRQMLQRVW
jgi:hypothetical protein